MKLKSVSAIIPAAGNSGRMGTDKALLGFPGGINFANHLVNCYRRFAADPIVLVVNSQLDLSRLQAGPCLLVVNEHVERGRSWSIKIAIGKVPSGYSCFIQNVDNPFSEIALLEKLNSSLKDEAYMIPVCKGKGGHPVLLGSRIVDFIREMKDDTDFMDVLCQFERIEIPWPGEGILWNINTPAEYEQFIRKAQF
ncbi:MAG: NTP transferase domain-containing protein [Bacteroidetes bacterium]|nr:NTP transferase domain-containing protein [Bacteroidota bacterium]